MDVADVEIGLDKEYVRCLTLPYGVVSLILCQNDFKGLGALLFDDGLERAGSLDACY